MMKHIKHMKVFVILALMVLVSLIIFTSISLAAINSSLWTGTFSDMAQNRNSGDITGCEIRIVGSDQGYSGTIQFADAWPGKLFMLDDIRYDVGDIFFKLSSGPRAGSFRGSVTDNALTGILEVADYKLIRLHLPRKNIFWD